MKKSILLLMGAVLLFVSGCSVCNRADWPESPALGHMNVPQKIQYLANVKQTLINFRTTAVDLPSHQPPCPADEEQGSCHREGFHCEVARYVDVYAMPILNDAEALQNLETRLEVATVNLLGAYAFYETGSYSQARRLLKMYDKRYREDVSIQDALVDSRTMEFASLGEAARKLRAKLGN